MAVCYLCGEEMVDRGPSVNPRTKVKHGEHIIPNALRGKLISSEILCIECGNILNEQVDVGFNKYFQPITEQLKNELVRKDHGAGNAANKVAGFLYSKKYGQLKVNFHDFKIVPAQEPPMTEIDEATKTIKVYTHAFRGKQYKQQLASKLAEEGKNIADYSYNVIEDISGEGVIYLPPGLSKMEPTEQNIILFKGLNKIATEFAIYKGIPREQLTRTLNIQQRAIIYSDNVIPFLPIGALDRYREINRPGVERDYPTHTLILFSQERRNGNKALYCYIDLFSTFQFYVILNENFNEDFFADYYQTVLRIEKPVFNARKVRMKHLWPLISTLPVDKSAFKGKTVEELYDLLENHYPKMDIVHHRNLEEELAFFHDSVRHIASITDLGIVDLIPHPLPSKDSNDYALIKDEIEVISNLQERIHLFPDEPAYKEVKPCLHFYKRLCKPLDVEQDFVSMPHEISKALKFVPAEFDKYASFKYYQLSMEINMMTMSEEQKGKIFSGQK